MLSVATMKSLSPTPAQPIKRDHRLEGLACQVYQLCDSAQSFANLQRHLGVDVSDEELRKTIAELTDARIMTEMDGQYLSLAVFRTRTAPIKLEEQNAYTQIQPPTAAKSLLHLV